MNESANISFKDSINKKLQKLIMNAPPTPLPKLPKPNNKNKGPFGNAKPAPMPTIKLQKSKNTGPFGDAPPAPMPKLTKPKRIGGKIYSNPSRKPKI